jgi:hypothetical protein
MVAKRNGQNQARALATLMSPKPGMVSSRALVFGSTLLEASCSPHRLRTVAMYSVMYSVDRDHLQCLLITRRTPIWRAAGSLRGEGRPAR